nr:reverse transcriptase [Tanacetum cinerariifolium]
MGVRMFKPKTLVEVYYLTNLQKALLNSIKRKNRLLYSGGASTSKFIPQLDVNQNTKPLLALPQNKPTPAYKLNNRKQLTQKKYKNKRAKNLCFYYDQKYAPGHKCHGQLYSLVVLGEEEEEEENLDGLEYVMLLKLKGYEMVLGIQWLSTLGEINFNFKDLRKEFMYKGKKMTLRAIQLWSMEGVNQDMPPELSKVETPLKRH